MSGFVKAAKGLRDLFEHHVRTPGYGCNEAERVKIGACFAAFDEALRTERDLTDSGPQSATSEMEAVLEPWRAVWKVAFEPYDDGRHADDEGVAPLMPLAWPTIGDLRKLANLPDALRKADDEIERLATLSDRDVVLEEAGFDYVIPQGSTYDEWREHVRQTALYQRGDTVLVWVNQADLGPTRALKGGVDE